MKSTWAIRVAVSALACAAAGCAGNAYLLESDGGTEPDGRASDAAKSRDAERDTDVERHEDGGASDAAKSRDAERDVDGGASDATKSRDAERDGDDIDEGTTEDAEEDDAVSVTGHDGSTADAPGGIDASRDASSPFDALPDAPSDASEAGPATPPSCVPIGSGTSECGSSNESCCTSLEVTGGTLYYRTYTNTGTGPTGEADVATVSSFRLDKYLVTVGRFRPFVAAWNGGYASTPSSAPANGSGKHTHLNGGKGLVNVGSAGGYETGWDATDWNNTTDVDPTTTLLQCQAPYSTWTGAAGSNENLPINCVTWYEAYAFCIWDGGFLPSEAEWEYAAAGGSQQLEYPWGAMVPGTMNQYAIYGSNYTANATDIAPVGTASLGAGYWKQLDLAGEVYEWTLDWDTAYAVCTDCANLAPVASDRVFRGGSFDNTTSTLLPPDRGNDPPSDRNNNIGFRCARTP